MSTRGRSSLDSCCTVISTHVLSAQIVDIREGKKCCHFHPVPVMPVCTFLAYESKLYRVSLLSLLALPQTRHQQPNHAEQHACCVGEDELQLAGPGSLPLDPGGPSPLPRQGFQLNTSLLRPFFFSCLCHIYSMVWLLALHKKIWRTLRGSQISFLNLLLCYFFYPHDADLSVITCVDIESIREFFVCLFYAGFWL